MERINITVTKDHVKRLKAEAKKTGLTVSEIIRRAVDEYLAKEKKP